MRTGARTFFGQLAQQDRQRALLHDRSDFHGELSWRSSIFHIRPLKIEQPNQCQGIGEKLHEEPARGLCAHDDSNCIESEDQRDNANCDTGGAISMNLREQSQHHACRADADGRLRGSEHAGQVSESCASRPGDSTH